MHEPGAWLLGSQSDGDAVAVVYRDVNPNRPASALLGRQVTDAVAAITGHPELVALHPGGGSTTLVTVPDSANRIDLTRNLVDRFGAAPRSLPTRLIN